MVDESQNGGGSERQVQWPEAGMTAEELVLRLRINTLDAHQLSVGRGDKLVEILERSIGQMESTHGRIQLMSTLLFAMGLLLVAAAGYQIIFGGVRDLWTALIGAGGGVATLAATFWTAPLEKMSRSVSDLVKLEAAFLGYIRVIGEIDSAFQMQYLDTLSGEGKLSLEMLCKTTTERMKEMMEKTLALIDTYVGGPGKALQELTESVAGLEKQLAALEARLEASAPKPASG